MALGISPFIMSATESAITIVMNHGLQTYGGDLYVGSMTILQSVLQLDNDLPWSNSYGSGTRISTSQFALPLRAKASLRIYDVRGRLVRTILREEVERGEQIVTWDCRDEGGRSVAAGQYLARLRVQGPGLDEDQVRKLVVLR